MVSKELTPTLYFLPLQERMCLLNNFFEQLIAFVLLTQLRVWVFVMFESLIICSKLLTIKWSGFIGGYYTYKIYKTQILDYKIASSGMILFHILFISFLLDPEL
jgi:hypothetical protein